MCVYQVHKNSIITGRDCICVISFELMMLAANSYKVQVRDPPVVGRSATGDEICTAAGLIKIAQSLQHMLYKSAQCFYLFIYKFHQCFDVFR